jgi:protein-S-isoprenylcysteine O-methyltransferase Ste14
MAGAAESGGFAVARGDARLRRWPEPVPFAGGKVSRTFARGEAPGAANDATSRWLRLRPPTIARALAAIAMALHALVFGFEAPLGRSIVGGALVMAAGFAWMAWAWWQFRRAGTPLLPTAQPTLLVDEGPYRFGRNPMYLGMTMLLLGMGLAAGVPFMAVAALNFAVIVGAVHVPHEEAQLRRAFGGWYSDYAASVRRWF